MNGVQKKYATWNWWYLLFIVQFIAVPWPPFYNKAEPSWMGVPFFYCTYTRWFNSWALLIGWAVGTFAGTAMAVSAGLKPAYPLAMGGYSFPRYTAFYTVILNLLVAVVLTLVFGALRTREPADETAAADYHA